MAQNSLRIQPKPCSSRPINFFDLEKKQKKAVSEATDILQEETIALIKKLPMKDILHLLVAKWIEPVRKGIANLFDKEVKDFAEKLDALDTKYCDTLVNIDERIAKSEKSLASLIDNLTGSDFDMAGLREFQNFCAMSKTLKPQIRFKGYDGEWQQAKVRKSLSLVMVIPVKSGSGILD